MIFNLSKILPKSLKDTENLTSVQTNWYTPEVVYRRIAKTTRRCIKNLMLMISVIFKILLNSIVCFLHISSSYFRVRGVIKVVVFSRFYGISKWFSLWGSIQNILQKVDYWAKKWGFIKYALLFIYMGLNARVAF